MHAPKAQPEHDMTLIQIQKMRETVVFNLQPLKIKLQKKIFSIRFKHWDSLYDQQQIILPTHEPLIGSEWGLLHHDSDEHIWPNSEIKF